MGQELLLPCTLVVEESIRSLLVFFCDRLRFLMPLEPCLILLVKPPALTLQRFRSHVLLVSVLAVIKDIEQSIRVYFTVQARVV